MNVEKSRLYSAPAVSFGIRFLLFLSCGLALADGNHYELPLFAVVLTLRGRDESEEREGQEENWHCDAYLTLACVPYRHAHQGRRLDCRRIVCRVNQEELLECDREKSPALEVLLSAVMIWNSVDLRSTSEVLILLKRRRPINDYGL